MVLWFVLCFKIRHDIYIYTIMFHCKNRGFWRNILAKTAEVDWLENKGSFVEENKKTYLQIFYNKIFMLLCKDVLLRKK